MPRISPARRPPRGRGRLLPSVMQHVKIDSPHHGQRPPVRSNTSNPHSPVSKKEGGKKDKRRKRRATNQGDGHLVLCPRIFIGSRLPVLCLSCHRLPFIVTAALLISFTIVCLTKLPKQQAYVYYGSHTKPLSTPD